MDCHTMVMAMSLGIVEPGRPVSIGSVDHATLPLRCHWEREEDAERCTSILDLGAASWALQVDQAGFVPPVPDADGMVDLYLYDFGGGGAYTSCSTWEDTDPADGLTGCPGYVVLSPGLTDELMPTYVAHEFNHVLQYAIDFYEPTYPVWEGIASAFEIWTFPEDVQLTIDYSFADFQAAPWAGLLNLGSYLWPRYGAGWAYEYSTAIWGLHLDHHFGDGAGSSSAALWLALAQRGPNTVDVIDGLEVVTGDWRDTLLSLSAERILLGTEDAPEWLPQQQAKLRLVVDGEYTQADLPLTHRPSIMPYTTGAVYVRVGGVEGAVDIEVEAADGQWGVVVARGPELTWVAERTLRWSGDGDIVVGLVNLDHDAFATTGAFGDLTASQREVRLRVSAVEAPDDTEDTGVTEDTGAAEDTTEEPPDDTGRDERAPPSETGLAKGCATAPAPLPALYGVALVAVALRRARGRRQ